MFDINMHYTVNQMEDFEKKSESVLKLRCAGAVAAASYVTGSK